MTELFKNKRWAFFWGGGTRCRSMTVVVEVARPTGFTFTLLLCVSDQPAGTCGAVDCSNLYFTQFFSFISNASRKSTTSSNVVFLAIVVRCNRCAVVCLQALYGAACFSTRSLAIKKSRRPFTLVQPISRHAASLSLM